MNDFRFDWNPEKNELNKIKHGVSFEEAESVFDDPDYIITSDEEHSDVEERFHAIGYSELARMLVVCHCYRKSDEIIRLISARKAEKSEVKLYGGRL